MAKKKALKKKDKILPRKLSKLIEIALKDLKKVEATKDMFVDMGEWLDPTQEVVCAIESTGQELDRRNVCTACLAGSVMAFTLGKKGTTKYLRPEDMGNNQKQLEAINLLREGSVISAAQMIDVLKDGDFDELADLEDHISDYDPENPKPFHTNMEGLRKKLIKIGY